MGKLIVHMFITMDGVIQSPGNMDKDVKKDFSYWRKKRKNQHWFYCLFLREVDGAIAIACGRRLWGLLFLGPFFPLCSWGNACGLIPGGTIVSFLMKRTPSRRLLGVLFSPNHYRGYIWKQVHGIIVRLKYLVLGRGFCFFPYQCNGS